ncbi:hypothetical protein A9Q91_00085 [Candidatus Gracilibacteria bacterium 28_42_T64]|nr:hypothetical protein A9Q91_00085 [Candidatus Gracilibacteria bacterium 28_42_T64]
MGLDDITLSESSEGGAQSVEISEKFKEAAKKAGAGIKRTQKDEKKAKKSDLLLAGFLVKIIIDKKYDSVLIDLFKSLHSGYPSNFLLGIISLIHIGISNKIREASDKEKIAFNYYSDALINFDDQHLPVDVQNRINWWVEDMILIVSHDYSSILTQQLIDNLNEKDEIILFTSKVFEFFLKEININITVDKAFNISEFILSEVEKEIKKLEIEEI